MHRRGFTLIELIIDIAIIAALVAVLAPVYAHARERARRTVCLSNVKQISAAALLYSQDYDQVLPAACAWEVAPFGPNSVMWPCAPTLRKALEPYAKDEGVYRCPDHYAVAKDQWRQMQTSYWFVAGHPGYVVPSSDTAGCEWFRKRNLAGESLVNVSQSAVLVSDSGPLIHEGKGAGPWWSGVGGAGTRYLNLGFVDGHAKGESFLASHVGEVFPPARP